MYVTNHITFEFNEITVNQSARFVRCKNKSLLFYRILITFFIYIYILNNLDYVILCLCYRELSF